MSADEAADLAHKLATGTWAHDYPITASEAKALGLQMKTDIAKEVLELMTLYPLPVLSQVGCVEYSASEAA